MEDLASMITQFLGSEEGMNQLRAVTEALGLDSPGAGNGGTPPAASPSPAVSWQNKRRAHAIRPSLPQMQVRNKKANV